MFEDYKQYLLGDYVNGLTAKDADGNTIATPLEFGSGIREGRCESRQQTGEPGGVHGQ